MRKSKKLKIGLALGGGGIRGYAHIGVLKALEEEKINVDIITGTSAGAIVGGNYAFFRNASVVEKRLTEGVNGEVLRKIRKIVLSESKEEKEKGFFYNVKETLRKGILYTSSVRKISFIDETVYDIIIRSLVPDVKIENLSIPFIAVSFDIVKGEEILFREGSLRFAVKASSAIPGIFPPVQMNNSLLVDGGWLHLVPVLPLKNEGADLIIAVDVSREPEPPEDLLKGINVLLRAYEMARNNFKELLLQRADIVIRPDVGSIHWADFTKGKECIKRGYEATMNKIPQLKKIIKEKSERKWLF